MIGQNTFKLRWIIPLVLTAVAASYIGATYLYLIPDMEKRIEKKAISDLSDHAAMLQEMLESFFRLDNLNSVKREIVAAGSWPEHKWIVVVDDNRKIVVASDLSLEGQNIYDAGLPISKNLLDKTISDKLGSAKTVKLSNELIIGYLHIDLGRQGSEIRPSRFGSLIMAFDITRPLSEGHRQATQAIIVLSALMIVGVTILGLSHHIMLTRRVWRLLKSVRALASGAFSTRCQISGSDEIGSLGKAFDTMAEILEDRVRQTQESEEKFRVIIERAPEAIIVYDADNMVIINANIRARQLFNCSHDKLVGSTHVKYYDKIQPNCDDINEAVDEHNERALAGEEVIFERNLVSEGGHPRICEVRLVRLPNRDRHLLRASFIDITERKRAEIELLNAKRNAENALEEMQIAQKEMQAARDRADAANRAKSRFLANMSHELRTPLNAVIGFGDLLEQSETDPEKKEYLQIISTAGKDLLDLIQDILDLSKIESGKVRADIVDFNLSDEVSHAALYFHSQAVHKGLSFTINLPKEAYQLVRGDAVAVRQVLMNLIGNALKFTTAGSIELSVSISKTDLSGKIYVIFHVTDTGIGIMPENQDRVFSMFEQEDISMTKRFGGAGLGLAISKKLVSAMGGKIWVESSPGVGSRFSFTAIFDQPSTVVDHKAGVRGVVRAAPNANLLIVEDDAFNRKLLVKLLEDNGYRVRCAEDGVNALLLLEQNSFNAILMDIQLPGQSGIEITHHIRSGYVKGCDPKIPIIAVTAYALSEDRERFLKRLIPLTQVRLHLVFSLDTIFDCRL